VCRENQENEDAAMGRTAFQGGHLLVVSVLPR
jgi:hypothetical protein